MEEVRDIFELIDEFCEQRIVNRNSSEHTVRAYRGDLEAFAAWLEENELVLAKLNRRSLRSYLVHLSQKNYYAKTLNRKLSALRSFFSWCFDSEYLKVASACNVGRRCL